MKQTVYVIGGGLVGALTSIQLAKKGIEVFLYEQQHDMRVEKAKGGRSINLALTARGFSALANVGLADKVRQVIMPMTGRQMHDTTGNLTYVPYSKNPTETNDSVSREGLTKFLLSEAEALGVSIRFGHRCTGYDPDRSVLMFGEGADLQEIPAEVVIGTDGGGASAVMHKVLDAHYPDNYTREKLDYRYKELSFPAGENGSFLMDNKALHIWSRNSEYMLIALPNRDGTFTGTLFLRDGGAVDFNTLTADNVTQLFQEQFPDALALMPNLESDFRHNPIGELHTVKCGKWHLGDKLLIIGDAAHAVVPFHGQGMNGGFEDVIALGTMIDRYSNDGIVDWKKVFEATEAERKPNTDKLAIMSLNNLKDMLTTADAKSLLKRNIGFKLEEMSEQEGSLKDRFLAHYTMITFRPHIPYAQVFRRDEIQNGILDELASNVVPHDREDWARHVDWDKATQLVVDRLEPIAGNAVASEQARGHQRRGSFTDLVTQRSSSSQREV